MIYTLTQPLNAFDYAFGVNPAVAPLVIQTGAPAGTGVSLTLVYGQFTLPNGTVVAPISTTTPITIGIGSNAETVTPTAVSNPTPSVPGTCVITVTTSNAHGAGDFLTTGSFGMAEAVNVAHANGGGLVAFDGRWTSIGGNVSQFAGKTYGWANVTLLPYTGTSGVGTSKSYVAANGGAYANTSGVQIY